MAIPPGGGSGCSAGAPEPLGPKESEELKKLRSELSPEIRSRILSHSGEMAINREDRAERLKQVIAVRAPEVENIIKFFAEHTKGHPEIALQLNEMLKGHPLRSSGTLLDLKKELFDVRSHLASILKSLSDVELSRLEFGFTNLTKHASFASLLKLASLYKQVDQAQAIADELVRGRALNSLITAFIEVSDLKMATSVAGSISGNMSKSDSLNTIVKAYAKQGRLAEATLVAMSIPHESHRSIALKNIVEAYILQGRLDEATLEAMSILDETFKNLALSSITNAYTEKNLLKEATSVAGSISSDITKSDSLMTIVKAYLKQDRLDEATSVAMSIPGEIYRSRALEGIAKARRGES